jgi:hypothetical protein
MHPDKHRPKQETLPLGQATSAEIKDYNDNVIQTDKPENQKQTSYEKLDIQDWEVREISGREILNLQYFVETTGQGAQAYLLWKHFGHNVHLSQLMERLRLEEIPDYARSFLKELIPKDAENPDGYDPEKVEERIKEGDIYPPLIIYPMFNGQEKKDLGLLKLGNIADGTHRLMEIAKLLSQKDEDYIDNFRIRVAVGHIPIWKYISFTALQFSKAIKAKAFANKESNIPPKHVMDFFETWHLLLQRIGFKD